MIRKLSLSILTLSLVSVQAAPLYVGLVDSPLDYGHQALSRRIDREAVESGRYFGPIGRGRDWLTLNNLLLGKLISEEDATSARWLLSLEYTHIQNMAFSDLPLFLPEPTRLALLVRALCLEVSGICPLNNAELYHGTHVASTMLEGLNPDDDVRLVNFQIPEYWRMANEVIYNGQEYRILLRHYFQSITETLLKYNVRVVNMSWEFRPKILARILLESLTANIWPFREGANLLHFAAELNQTYFEEIKEFLDNNPNTLFVFAAGNDGHDMSMEVDERLRLRQRNTLIVGAEDLLGNRADFSNYGYTAVDLFAPGDGVLAAAAGTHNRVMASSGTSMAAPKVSMRARQILQHAPWMDPETLRAYLLVNETEVEPKLIGASIGARRLKSRPHWIATYWPKDCASMLGQGALPRQETL